MTPEHAEKLAASFFRYIWSALADKHRCDIWGGAEQQRVLREWLDAGCPLPIVQFITKHANTSPEVKS